ncbi:MAG: sensor histidine kinase [Clostridia bacterium]|nr:sensor histidine kinase [Clostridia bacterium]
MKDLSLHILDIVQNSIKAKALNINIELEILEDNLVLTINDDGCGISEEILKNIFDPFITTRTTRKVGLGLSLLKTNVEFAGGKVQIESIKHKGTKVTAWMPVNNIDRKPLGNLAETIKLLILSDNSMNMTLKLINGKKTMQFDTTEIKKQIDGVDINNNEVINWIYEYINEGIIEIFGGVLNEITC